MTAPLTGVTVDTVYHRVTITAGETGRVGVAISGEVDASNADRVRLAILTAADRPGVVVEVDLAGVTFMDSTGLRAVAGASGALVPRGSALVLCNVPRQVARLLAVTDIGADLEIRR